MKHRTGMAMVVVAVALIAGIAGCVTEREQKSSVYAGKEIAAPKPPEAIARLPELLLTYRAKHGGYPATLEQLPIEKASHRSLLREAAYSADSLGDLRSGGRIMLVDAQIRVPNQAWCIIEREGTTLSVELVSMAHLQMAAEDAARDAATN